MKDILYFDSLITPKILTILYWLALVVVVIGGISMIFTGSFFTGLLSIVFGALAIRVSFEMIMIAFKNNEYLKKIAEK